MSKVDLEKAIMDAAKSIPATYGEYRLVKDFRLKIANIMGYKVLSFTWHHLGGKSMPDLDEYNKVTKIMKAMADKGYIKFSKSGQAYKVLF